jgi:hypothetical protein
MLKRFLISIFLLTLVFAGAAVHAEDEAIEYGQKVTGEITSRNFEIPYVFSGKAKDMVIIEMRAVGTNSKLTNPAIILLNQNGDVVADTTRAIAYLNAFLVVQLPKDDDYTILASRSQGRSGKSVGQYTLELIQPEVLEAGSSLDGELSSKGRSNYYVIQSTGAALDLAYQKQTGQFFPQVSVARISTTNGFLTVASMSGRELLRGQINVPSTRGLYIVTVGRSPLDILPTQEVKTTYQLKLLKPAQV